MASLLDIGIYTISEAALLTGVSQWRIRRWLRGYEFKTKHGRHRSPPIWQGQIDPLGRSVVLGFLDLIEVRFVNAFLEAGVSWNTLRQAHSKAQEILNQKRPFCTNRFGTDGRAIFLQARELTAEGGIYDVANFQRVFDEITLPFLKNLEFASGEVAERWWPMGKEHAVAIDPRRNFGQPTIFDVGVPTRVLARSVQANGSVADVAQWFAISVHSVEEAVAYERQLAA